MAEDDCVELGTEMRMLQLGTAVAETEHLSESLHGKDAQRLTAGRHLRNCGLLREAGGRLGRLAEQKCSRTG